MIAGQVITQLTADDADAGPAVSAQRGFGLLVPSRGQASGPGGLPDDYRSLAEAVAAVAAETGGVVTCVMAAQRAGLDVTGRQAENVRARLKRLEDRGWLRRTAAGRAVASTGSATEAPSQSGFVIWTESEPIRSRRLARRRPVFARARQRSRRCIGRADSPAPGRGLGMA